jgi:hypothetical protein
MRDLDRPFAWAGFLLTALPTGLVGYTAALCIWAVPFALFLSVPYAPWYAVPFMLFPSLLACGGGVAMAVGTSAAIRDNWRELNRKAPIKNSAVGGMEALPAPCATEEAGARGADRRLAWIGFILTSFLTSLIGCGLTLLTWLLALVLLELAFYVSLGAAPIFLFASLAIFVVGWGVAACMIEAIKADRRELIGDAT